MKRHSCFKIALAVSTFILVMASCSVDDSVELDYQSRYVGEWDCEEKTGVNAPQFYTVEIEAGDDQTKIIIKNLYNLPLSISASISELALSIPAQSVNEVSFSGSGSANADFEQIVINFTANDGSITDNVQAYLRPKS